MDYGFRKFTHVERLEDSKVNVRDFLNGTVYVTSKADGTAAVIWSDEKGNIRYGSRTRELSLNKDNQGFMAYMSIAPEAENLRHWLANNPNYIVYGEWLGIPQKGFKQAGTIKKYLRAGFWVYAVYSRKDDSYVTYDEYKIFFDGVWNQVIEPLAVLDHPTYDEVVKYLDNSYNLPDDVQAEGIVMHRPDYRDERGRNQICKIVNQEYLANKGVSKKERINIDNIELQIATIFVTLNDVEKSKAKIVGLLEIDDWEINKRTMGMLLNFVWEDLIQEEMVSILKMYRNPTINFTLLRRYVNNRVREFLGLL